MLGEGMNHSGQLGSGVRSDEPTFSAIDTSGMEILGLACGREHSMLLARAQEETYDDQEAPPTPIPSKTILFGFGNSMYGQLGLGGSKDTLTKELAGEDVPGHVFEPSPTSVQLSDPDENVIQVQCGLDHTVLRTGKHHIHET